MTLAHRLFGRTRFLAWPVVLCVSLAAHAGVALWLTQAEPPQTEGDPLDTPPLEVAYIPAPTPTVKPLADPILETLDPELAPPRPARPPVQASPVMTKPASASPQPKQEAKVKTAQAEKNTTPKAKPPRPKPEKQAERAKTPERVDKKAVKHAATEATSARQANPAKASTAAGNRKWASKIRSRIERRKKYPAAAKGAAGSVTVLIQIAASGALSGVALAGSSGNAALDAAALKAVQNAAPFPPAPAGEGGAEFSLTMVFSRG